MGIDFEKYFEYKINEIGERYINEIKSESSRELDEKILENNGILVFPKNVKQIDLKDSTIAFRCLKNLKNIDGENLHCIGNGTFKDCNSLISPGKITKAGKYAFYGCENLITTGDIEIANDFAFLGCKSLTNTGKVKQVGSNAFALCTKLESLGLDIKFAAHGAFNECIELISTGGVTEAEEHAFRNCKSLKDKGNIETYKTSTFVGCAKIEKYNAQEKSESDFSNNEDSIESKQVENVEQDTKSQKVDNFEKVDEVENVEQTKKSQKADNFEKVDEVEIVEQTKKSQKADNFENVEQTKKSQKVDHIEKVDEVDEFAKLAKLIKLFEEFSENGKQIILKSSVIEQEVSNVDKKICVITNIFNIYYNGPDKTPPDNNVKK